MTPLEEIAFVRQARPPLYMLAELPLREYYNEEDLIALPVSKARFTKESILEENCYDYDLDSRRFVRRGFRLG